MKFDNGHIIKYLKTLAKIAGVFLLLALLVFFSFRNTLLRKVLDRVARKLKTEYHTDMSYGAASFTGLASVEIKQLSLVPEQKDTLLYIGELQSSIRLAYALLFDFRLKELTVKDSYLNLVKTKEGTNLDYFLKNKRDSSTTAEDISGTEKPRKSNYASTTYRLISKALAQVPNDVLLENCALRLTELENHVSFEVNKLSLLNELLESEIHVVSNSVDQQWIVSGNAQPWDKKADIHLYNKDTGRISLPFISERYNLSSGFDSLKLNLSSVEMDDDVLKVKGFASISNFLVNHPKISKRDVVIDRAEIDYTFLAGSNSVSLDSTTSVTFNQVKFNPFISFENAPDTLIRFGILIPRMPAQQFISSLPEGLFKHFKGMEVVGEFEYRLDFVYNENRPQDLVFESDLKKYGFAIRKYGEANLSKLNADFVYTPIEYGRPQRPIMVSMENPSYTPLDQISPYLKKAVLTTEDPSFFYHRGFIDEAFRQSIIKNIRKRKFARGASTISMQLVKNVFLTREKTISRKLEEILLVYILENNRLSSKERMFEVYLNIIEWGPNVYGIGEASQFYFQKKPSELTLGESLFLATIIPRPKGFMWRFDKQGNLKDFVGRQFHFLSDLMIRREVLIPEDTVGLTHLVPVTGRAKEFIKLAPDTNVMDTFINPEMIMDVH